MYARNVKPNSSQNGIKFILQYILTALALQSVRIADERVFAKGKTNGIFFVNTRQKQWICDIIAERRKVRT